MSNYSCFRYEGPITGGMVPTGREIFTSTLSVEDVRRLDEIRGNMTRVDCLTAMLEEGLRLGLRGHSRSDRWFATFNAALAGGKSEAQARAIADKVHGK